MFFDYRQNNSGGSFITNCDVDVFVIIEAESAAEADDRAQDIGIYFDGCDSGFDCPCCGDRWYRAYEGEEVPSLYGQPVEQFKKSYGEIIIHYLDGRKVFM